MIWYNSQPKSDWEEQDGAKTISLLSSLDDFGIILHKTQSQLSLYLGAGPEEIHHITSVPDVVSTQCILPNMFFEKTYTMKLKNSYIHPLCTEMQLPKIYEQSSILGDFSLGIIGNRADPNRIRKKSKSYLEKLRKRSADIKQNDITKPVEFKLEQNHFFACEIFFSCAAITVDPFLSSVNFTRKLATPNGMIPKHKSITQSIINTVPKIPWFGGEKIPVLSLVEIASVLSLPPTLFGLEMRSGNDKTFSNLRGNIDDPAKFFENLGE